MLSRRVAAVVTILVVVAFVVVAVAPAFAATPGSLAVHAQLLGSTPRDGSTVETADEVVLEFNEDVDPTFVTVVVEGPDGSEVAGSPVVDGRSVTQPLSPSLGSGEHVVTYRVVSTDGHPVAGRLTFTTTAAPTPSTEPTASATPSAGTTASAPPSPLATAPATEPVTEGSSSPWARVLAGLAAVLAGLALAVSWRHLRGSRADAQTDAAADDARTHDEDDPFRPARDDARGPFA
ncbi:MAG TPA: copper resistance CopC family protein [Ornithinibacter sp.]|nr:copper resistance CopC family protein [Ornithinibacter sp.]